MNVLSRLRCSLPERTNSNAPKYADNEMKNKYLIDSSSGYHTRMRPLFLQKVYGFCHL